MTKERHQPRFLNKLFHYTTSLAHSHWAARCPVAMVYYGGGRGAGLYWNIFYGVAMYQQGRLGHSAQFSSPSSYLEAATESESMKQTLHLHSAHYATALVAPHCVLHPTPHR